MTHRVLVIEDQEDNRRILRDMLGSAGIEVLEARDGVTGVATALRERPDLILMDIQMPRMDGYEATRRIKSSAEGRDIPIIAVTSYALSGDEALARQAGCDDYVTKPFSPRLLLELVRQRLPKDD
ncbi:response regulator [Ruegeria sediminis]|uniref:Response regulator n=1 Tax=Ruegeria sediminis TaxID=2583820 RepID=A0ABY2WUD9_9RHOB|nr:response regulator [Ruegeria sediminis]TMV05622.1 response regulator [Ruegeria sediminis]